MAVTALVLGGANLAGGRGSAFGSLLGALNIYLITYVLSTFNFGIVQSFVTDLAYGVMLVVSLLISLTVPQIQKRVRNLSPLVFFVILAVIVLGVIMHTSMDQVTEQLVGVSASASSFVILDDGGVAKVTGEAGNVAYSAGTYVLFIVIGIVAVVYGFRVLFRYPKAPMVAFMIVMGITALGLIFNPDHPVTTEIEVASKSVPEGMDAYTPTFFALETVDQAQPGQSTLTPEQNLVDATTLVAHLTSVLLTIIGVILLASLIILVMLPDISIRTKRTAMLLFGGAVAVIAIGGLFFDNFDQGYLTSNLSGEMYAVILVGVGLFTLTAPLVHTKFRNISNVFIILIGSLAVISVYFFTTPNTDRTSETTTLTEQQYAPSIFTAVSSLSNDQTMAITKSASDPIAGPARVNVDQPGMAAFTQVAYGAFIIVMLHVFLYIAMSDISFRSFWTLWPIPIFSALLWGGLFYAVGVPLWQIITIIAIAAVLAPNSLHIIITYYIKQGRDKSISQWGGS